MLFLGITTQKRMNQGAHVLSGAVTLLGPMARIVVHRSSQTERQFRKLSRSLEHFTSKSSLELRNDVVTYGEDRFWGRPSYVHLDPGVERIVEDYVTKAKAA